MTRVADYLLPFLQWALVLTGATLLVSIVRTHMANSEALDAAPFAARSDTFFIGPSLLTGICLGLVSIGIGAMLFYLRRPYVARR